MTSTLMQASRQWSSRPADQRFTSLLDLQSHMRAVHDHSVAKNVSSRQLTLQPDPESPRYGMQVVGQNGTPATLTHWAFGQIAQRAGAPSGYMRQLPAAIAADCLNYGLKYERDIEDVGVLLTRLDDNGMPELRAATGPRYGRVWNREVVDCLVDRFGDGLTGDFTVPGEFGKAVEVTNQNTTIYGSDRDMFVFLADEKNRIEVPNRRHGTAGTMSRGFFVWNSEVGSQSLGAAFFLFDYVCCNRIVWGAEQFHEVRIRHTAGAPDRWMEDVTPILQEYSEASAQPVLQAIENAQARRLDDVDAFLANRFGKTMVAALKDRHEIEEGRPIETLWDVTTAITAAARDVTHQDRRVEMERQAGKIMEMAS